MLTYNAPIYLILALMCCHLATGLRDDSEGHVIHSKVDTSSEHGRVHDNSAQQQTVTRGDEMTATGEEPELSPIQENGNAFLSNIFDRYGSDEGRLSFKGLVKLFIKMGIRVDEKIPEEEEIKEEEQKDKKDNSADEETQTDRQNSRGKRSHDVTHGEDHLTLYQKEGACLSPSQILTAYHIDPRVGLSKNQFRSICPVIIYDIEQSSCLPAFTKTKHVHGDSHEANQVGGHSHSKKSISMDRSIPAKVWGYSILAVTLISVGGLACVAIIPVMRRFYFDEILGFLVAMAVGTLTGDALLHLIPHAMTSDIVNAIQDPVVHENAHIDGVWKGATVLGGIYLFFVMERIMSIINTNRAAKRKMSKKNSQLYKSKSILSIGSSKNGALPDETDIVLVLEDAGDDVTTPTSGQTDDYVEVTHHDDDDEGHGHSHEVPDSAADFAWMVIMGDGLHNFTDGLAIGSAFSNSIPGGFSTTFAVFCHELPHELGDFAVLLRAGMKVKKALFFNIVSSALSFMGVFCGIFLGNIASLNLWVFAFTAGIFIYLSLVDMIPELTRSGRCKHPFRKLALQSAGAALGVGIMILIALNEDKLDSLFGGE